jgi:hypothetical protein
MKKRSSSLRYKYVCNQCGSDKLSLEMSGRWDHKKQEFIVISDTPFYSYCNKCEYTDTWEIKIIKDVNKNIKVL